MAKVGKDLLDSKEVHDPDMKLWIFVGIILDFVPENYLVFVSLEC